MTLDREDLMHIARAVKQHKISNLKLGKALLEADFPASKIWATLLESNNANLDNLFKVILDLSGPFVPPDANAQLRDTGEDLTQAGVLLAYVSMKGQP